MARQRDPVTARADETEDLQEISRWEVRSRLDRLSAWLYRGIVTGTRWVVVGLAVLILLAQFVLGGLGLLTDRPVVTVFTVLSVLPAFALAAYVWYADVTTSEPLELLVVTFLFGVLFASFAGLLNDVGQNALNRVGLGMVPVLGLVLFFFLVVGPVEESVKLLAVRLHAYRSGRFDAVIDGAVYGAAAGLGFATIENALYITTTVGAADVGNAIGVGGSIATVRALAGPGHVIYSAFAGYYLGLAKFNREQAGPLVVKGIIVATLIHGGYNASATVLVPLAAAVLDVNWLVAFVGFVVAYDSLFGYLLLRKLARYRRAFHDAREGTVGAPELTEFDP